MATTITVSDKTHSILSEKRFRRQAVLMREMTFDEVIREVLTGEVARY